MKLERIERIFENDKTRYLIIEKVLAKGNEILENNYRKICKCIDKNKTKKASELIADNWSRFFDMIKETYELLHLEYNTILERYAFVNRFLQEHTKYNNLKQQLKHLIVDLPLQEYSILVKKTYQISLDDILQFLDKREHYFEIAKEIQKSLE